MDASLLGLELPAVTFRPSERLSIPQYARSIGDADPRFTSEEAAAAAGYAGRPLPLSMLFFVQTISEATLQDTLKVRYGRTLFVGFELEWHRVATERELITGQTRVIDVQERTARDGRPRVFVTLESRFWGSPDDPIATARFTFIDQPEESGEHAGRPS
jgi:hypothetical protein